MNTHNLIKIGDTIYDNINPKGIDINLWKEDILFEAEPYGTYFK